MLRHTGQTWSGDGGSAAGGEIGGGARGEEWSERFFYLSGHFLRYKKHSRNLTSVNLKQVRPGGRSCILIEPRGRICTLIRPGQGVVFAPLGMILCSVDPATKPLSGVFPRAS